LRCVPAFAANYMLWPGHGHDAVVSTCVELAEVPSPIVQANKWPIRASGIDVARFGLLASLREVH
jgi:hypothetical protein